MSNMPGKGKGAKMRLRLNERKRFWRDRLKKQNSNTGGPAFREPGSNKK